MKIPHSQLFLHSCSAHLLSTPGRASCRSLGHHALPPGAQAHVVTCHWSYLYYLFWHLYPSDWKFSSVQSLSHVRLFVTPWIAARQASLSITNSRSSLKLMSIESVMPSSYIILCHPFLLLLSIFPRIRGFSNESVLRIRWPKYWSFSFSISPSNEYSGLISLGWTGWISLKSKGLSRVFSNTTVQKQLFGTQLSL